MTQKLMPATAEMLHDRNRLRVFGVDDSGFRDERLRNRAAVAKRGMCRIEDLRVAACVGDTDADPCAVIVNIATHDGTPEPVAYVYSRGLTTNAELPATLVVARVSAALNIPVE